MKISVIIPFYQSEPYFEECINSVLSQTYGVEEVIIVNDSPSDSSKTFLERYAKSCRIIHLDQNRGICVARNIGLANAYSDWIAFIDADDIWVENKLEEQVIFLKKNAHVHGCHTGIEVFNSTSVMSQYNDKPSNLSLEESLLISQVLPSSLLVKRNVLEDVGGFDEGAMGSEDREITLQLLRKNYQIGFVDSILVRYRRGHGNFSTNWEPKLKAHWYIFKKHYDLYVEHKKRAKYLRMMLLHAGYNSHGITSLFFRVIGKLIPANL